MVNKSFDKIEKKLQDEKQNLLLQIEALKKDDPFSDPDHASDNAAVDTDVREQNGHDTIEAEIADLQKRIKDIDSALKRGAKGQYGYCARCGKNIPAARLALIPEAQHCVSCENNLKR
jgi:DnaK suppressor protein